MEHQEIINETINYVKKTLADAEVGHDWWHISRVWKLSKNIAKNENVNLLVVELGALLHDIADSKFYNGDETIGPKEARDFLSSINVDEKIIIHIEKIIENISFRGNNHVQEFSSPELNVVQDADRLDSMGAIGIARGFIFAGNKNLKIYDPDLPPQLDMTKEEYKNYKRDTYTQINHFYEKLLLLKDKMNTISGKKIAEHRHIFMEQYLDEFYKEWEGEL